MKKRTAILLLVAYAFFMGPTASLNAAEWDVTLALDTRYRVDSLDWNVAGGATGANPNIQSELTWDDLEIFQIQAAGKAVMDNTYYLRASLGYGWIRGGDNQDSDFLGDNRTQAYSRSNNSADSGRVGDASAGIGYQFHLAEERVKIIPLVGYAYSRQNLKMTDGVQTLSLPPQTQPLGPFPNLDSSYNTEWYGPWTGLDVAFKANEKATFFAGLEYHWATYKAEADWNLVSQFAHPKSFTHDARGRGIRLSGGGEYNFASPWALGLEVVYQDWSTNPGTDQIFFANGSTAGSQLNEVNWNSLAVVFRATYRFGLGGGGKE